MTISTSTRTAGPFLGNGVTTVLPFTFKVFATTDLVLTNTSAAGVDTTLVLGTHYTVTLNANQDVSPGGNVTMLTAPPTGEKTTVVSAVPDTQTNVFTVGGAWSPTVMNSALDKLTILELQGKANVSRALKIPSSDGSINTELPTAAIRANSIMAFDSAGYPILISQPAGTSINYPNVQGPSGSSLVGFTQSGTGAVPRTTQEKMRESVSVKDFGAVGDGVANDTAAFVSASSTAVNALAPKGNYLVSSISPANGSLQGDGKSLTKLTRTSSNNGINIAGDNVTIKDITIDNKKSVNGFDSHAIVGNYSYSTLCGVQAIDYGATSGGGGCGACLYHSGATLKGLRMESNDFNANAAATTTIGWLYEGCDTSFASNIYAYHNTFCSHELKNLATYCGLSNLIAEYTGAALYYGQDTGTGPSYNVAVGVVGKSSDTGYTSGYANYNLTVGLLNNNVAAPGVAGTSHYARIDHGNGNAIYAGLSAGSYVNTIRYNGNNNYVQVAAHDTSSVVVQLMSGAAKNATEISHPGARTSIRSNITDSSGNAINSVNANPTWCHATGERIGSIGGLFYDKLGTSGAAYNSSHSWIKETGQYAVEAFLTPGNNGDVAGIAYNIPGTNNYGAVQYQKSSSIAADYWYLNIGGALTYRFFNSVFRTESDNTITLGDATHRWSTVYAGTGAINTSDAREKQDVEELSASEKRVAQTIKSLIRKFRFKDAVAEKGDKARIHFGVMAQDVASAFEHEGLNGFDYAMLCYDEWPEQPEEIDTDGNVIQPFVAAGNRYGVRYDELLAFVVGAV